MDGVLQVAEQRGYPLAAIDKILLVGGSSRMPQVAAMLEKSYGKKPTLQDPNLAVAKGAAIYARNRKAYYDFVVTQAAQSGRTVEELETENLRTHQLDKQYAAISSVSGESHISITNVLSRTYGLEVLGDDRKPRIYNMLMINDALPATAEQIFGTVADNQGFVTLSLYESRSTDRDLEIGSRTPITSFEMRFTRRVPIHTPIHVTLALDNSGMLHIIAEEQLYHSKLDTTFRLSNQLTGAEMQNAIARTAKAVVE